MTKRKLPTLLKSNTITPNILHWVFLITIVGAIFFVFRDAIPGQVKEYSHTPKSGIDAEGGIFSKKKVVSQTEMIPNKLDVLSSCVSDANAKYHYHVNLSISIFGRSYPVTKDIGTQEGCLHPIQVHDGTSGDIHIHSPWAYSYSLGDFFTTWGFIFNSKQFGSIFITPQYSIVMKVNGKQINTYENYVLKNKDIISIVIEKKSV